MTTQRRFQVFISSTAWDLVSERQAAVSAILAARHFPAGMEYFAAEHRLPIDLSKQWIEESDVFCLLLGPRYGTIDPDSGKSYTECEYDHAMKLGKPVCALVLDEAWIARKIRDSDRLREEIEQQDTVAYQAFRNKVEGKHVRLVGSLDGITAEVSQWIMAMEARDDIEGWVRSDEHTPSEHSFLNGPWVDAAYLSAEDFPPRGLVCFGSRSEVECKGRGFHTRGVNYDHRGSQWGSYESDSSTGTTFDVDYTFRWNTTWERESRKLGCGRLKIIKPLEQPSKQDATYSGYFFTESSPRFQYKGRKLRAKEQGTPPEKVVARWMEHLSHEFGAPIATRDQLSSLLGGGDAGR